MDKEEKMTVFEMEEVISYGANIKVIGVGGGGGNAINTMINYGLQNVDFIACNTDVQDLQKSRAKKKLQIGAKLTKGLGSGARPDIGRNAAIEDKDAIRGYLEGADMVFITAGLGGGTGTGASPVIAEISKEMGALTVAIVTKPFSFEGKVRANYASEGLKELKKVVDTMIVISNDKLLSIAGREVTFIEAFRMADDVLYQAVKGISDLITVNGLINLDFADIKTIMTDAGYALMGTGVASGENRAVEAARRAINNPLLEEISLNGARSLLINITGGSDMKLHEVSEATNLVKEEVHDDANIIFGAVIDERMKDEIKVTIIATRYEIKEEMQSHINIREYSSVFSRRDDPDIPTFLRREKVKEQLEKKKEPVIGFEDDEYDIPTFIRRRLE